MPRKIDYFSKNRPNLTENCVLNLTLFCSLSTLRLVNLRKFSFPHKYFFYLFLAIFTKPFETVNIQRLFASTFF